MKRAWVAALLALVLCGGITARGHQAGAAQTTPGAQLETAIKKEVVDGDLKVAVEMYRKLSQSSERSVAAKALVRMGQCYEKLGTADARQSYEQVLSRFADQAEAVAEARRRLAALGGNASPATPAFARVGRDFVIPSPDGRLLLGHADKGLSVRDVQSGQTRVLPIDFNYVSVSHDNRQLAFVQNRDEGSELHVIGIDGSGERKVWRASGSDFLSGLQWFPDGKRVMTILYGEKDARPVVISTRDGSITPLREGLVSDSVTLSPDGRSAVYIKRVADEERSAELWLVRLDEGSESLLFAGQSRIGGALWTPDGGSVVFLSDRRAPGVSVDLWLLRVPAGSPVGTPVLLRPDVGQFDQASPAVWMLGPITPAGTLYLQRLEMWGWQQLLKVGFDSQSGMVSGSPSFLSPAGGVSRSPSFSADGRLLAYLRSSSGAWGDATVVVREVASGVEHTVPMTPAPKGGPPWAVMFPDGRSLLFSGVHPRDGQGIYRVDVTTGTWTSLKKPDEKELWGFASSISPDGKRIYYGQWPRGAAPKETRIVARDVDSGREQELLRVSAPALFALSPDGAELAVAYPDGDEVVIAVMSAAGGQKREVYRLHGYRQSDVQWTADARFLLVAPSELQGSYATTCLRIPATGGEARPIGVSVPENAQEQFPRAVGIFRVSPDGRQLVYSAGSGPPKYAYEVWALSNFLPQSVPKATGASAARKNR